MGKCRKMGGDPCEVIDRRRGAGGDARRMRLGRIELERRRRRRRWRHRRQAADDLLEPAAAGRGARAVGGGGQRRQARARAGRRQGGEVPDQVRLAGRLDRAGGGLGAERDVGQRAQGGRRTTRRSATSASSTPARPRSRCRSSTRPGIAQVSPGNTAVGITSDDRARARRAGQVLPDRRAHLRPRAAQGHLPGRRAGRAGQGEGLRVGLHPQRQGGLRRGPGQERRARRRRRSGSRSRATRASTRTPPTTARWRRRSRRPARSASSTPASRPTTPSRSSRTSPPRCPTRRCSAPRAWASRVLRPEGRRLPADVAKRVLVTIPGVAPEEYPRPARSS